MPRLNDTQKSVFGYWWNLITDAAHGGFTATETISAANDVARNLGGSLTLEDNAAIATLYGYAKRMDNAAAQFQAAGTDAFITPDMIATPPYARSEQEQATFPQYHVQFYYEYIDRSGRQQVGIRTSIIPMAIGPTIGDVSDDIQTDAEAFAAKYEHQLVSAIPFQILAV